MFSLKKKHILYAIIFFIIAAIIIYMLYNFHYKNEAYKNITTYKNSKSHFATLNILQGSRVRIKTANAKPLYLFGVFIYGGYENNVINTYSSGTANMSSIRIIPGNNPYQSRPENALKYPNENLNRIIPNNIQEEAFITDANFTTNKNYCSSTADNDPNPFWEFTFSNNVPISAIEIYSRNDCCADSISNATIEIYDTSNNLIWNTKFRNITNLDNSESNNPNKPINLSDTWQIFQVFNSIKCYKLKIISDKTLGSSGYISFAGIFAYDNTGNNLFYHKYWDSINNVSNLPNIDFNSGYNQDYNSFTSIYPVMNSNYNIDNTYSYGFNALKISNETERFLCITDTLNKCAGLPLTDINGSHDWQNWYGPNKNISHSEENNISYWLFDFKNETSISGIELFPRLDCCFERAVNIIIQLLDQNNNIIATSKPKSAVQNTTTSTPNEYPIIYYIDDFDNTITTTNITATNTTENGTQPPVTGTQPPVSGTQPPVTGTQPPVTGIQPPVTGTQPPVTGTQPTRNPSITSSQIMDLLNNGMNINMLSSEGIGISTEMRGPTTNIVQTNLIGSSNIYSPFLYYNKGSTEKFNAMPSDIIKTYQKY